MRNLTKVWKTETANPALQAESAVLVSWWLRVPYFVGFQTKQIWDLQTMLYHPAKVPSLGLTLSLDSSRSYCDPPDFKKLFMALNFMIFFRDDAL